MIVSRNNICNLTKLYIGMNMTLTNNHKKNSSNSFISLFAGTFVGISTTIVLAVPSVLAQTTINNIPANTPVKLPPSVLPAPTSPNGFPNYPVNPSNPNTVNPTNPTNPSPTSPNGFPTYQINPNPDSVTTPNTTTTNDFPNNRIILNNQNVSPSN